MVRKLLISSSVTRHSRICIRSSFTGLISRGTSFATLSWRYRSFSQRCPTAFGISSWHSFHVKCAWTIKSKVRFNTKFQKLKGQDADVLKASIKYDLPNAQPVPKYEQNSASITPNSGGVRIWVTSVWMRKSNVIWPISNKYPNENSFSTPK